VKNILKSGFLLLCWLLISLILLIPAPVNADTHYAASLSTGDVQAAIDAAIDGDIVQLPVGISSWTAQVFITNKGITLKGAGIDQTVIVDDTPSPPPYYPAPPDPLKIEGQEGKPWRVTGITFIGLANKGGMTIDVNGTCKNWRIDHCRFYNTVDSINVKDYTYGLIDHCTFYTDIYGDTSYPGTYCAVFVGAGKTGNPSWSRPLTFGTSEAVYIEDCLFDHVHVNDGNVVPVHGYDGGRFVLRYSKCNMMLEAWGSSTDLYRGVISFEVYNNTMGGQRGAVYPIIFRGGAGVVFNNNVESGVFNTPSFYLGHYRTTAAREVYLDNSDLVFSRCNGLSPLDGNLPVDGTASGVHTGSNDSNVLVCSGKNWTPNQWAGYAVRNSIDPASAGYIVSNTSNTITTSPVMFFSSSGYTNCSMSDENKQVSVAGTGTIGPLVSFVTRRAGSVFNSICWFVNTSSSIPSSGTASISGGTGTGSYTSLAYLGWGSKNHWDNGDGFIITNGYPCLDQPGRAPIWATPVIPGIQPSEPIYEWNNTVDGTTNLDWTFRSSDNTTVPYLQDHIKEGRDYYTDTSRPGYTPYIYPHPSQLIGVVDTSSPAAPGAVYDGTAAMWDANVTGSTISLSANWTPGNDADSGVSGYRFAVGTIVGGADIKTWTTIGNVLSTTTAINLTMGTTYYFSVKSINGVGLASEAATNSNGQYVELDGTPPSPPGMVYDGPVEAADISSTTSMSQLSANWIAGADAESGISGYHYAIGTVPGGTDVLFYTPVFALSVTKTGLNLTVGTTYYFGVMAVNGALLVSTAATCSNGIVVVSTADATAPNPPGIVRDGTGSVDISSTLAIATLSANWTQGSDPESGITGYRYAIGTTPGSVNTAGWTTIGNVLAVSRNSLTLAAGTTYYFSVKSINGNNLASLTATNSNGQYVVAIDTGGESYPPPNIPVVRDGTGADASFTTSLTQLSANWDAVMDPESGIEKYWCAIGTSPGTSQGSANTLAWTDNGQLTFINATGLTLAEGVTYYFSVKAENGVGLQSLSATNSNGLVVLPLDASSPAVSGVTAQNITANTATVAWTTDEGATTLVEYGRTISYGRQTIENTAFVTSHNASLTGLI